MTSRPRFGSPMLIVLMLAALAVSVATLRSLGPTLGEGDEAHTGKADSYQMITGDDQEAVRERWNRIFKTQNFVYGETPSTFVKQSLPLLHKGGKALVLAMEEGRDAVFLARHGYEVTGIDFSDEAIRKAKRLAKKHNVHIQFINADLEKYDIQPETYDLIVSLNFYRKRLLDQIHKGLKPGGYVMWQSHTSQTKGTVSRAVRLDHLLKPGELASAFASYTQIVSRETLASEEGQRGTASLVARKP